MNVYAWIGLIGIIVAELLPFIQKSNRTRPRYIKAGIQIAIVLSVIVAVLLFQVPFLFAFLIGFLAMIVFDRKTYTKRRLLIYIPILLIISVASFILFREQPNYVLKHLKNHPETTSLYVVENGEELIAYESDTVRPLASTVKIIIAIEYGFQVDEGKVNPEEMVDVTELEKYYFKNTDGGAHEAWLKSIDKNQQQVTIHDVAKGMIVYSSNANTEYLMDHLGIDAINQRAQSLGLTKHEKVYPIVGGLYIAQALKDEDHRVEKLETMSMDAYRELANEYSQQMKDGTIHLKKINADLPLNVQKVWSDRLIGSTAKEYGQLLTFIQNNELPTKANEIIRDLLEWPMQMNEQNKEIFTYIGAKGGSTAFVLTDALYAKDLNKNTFEFVILTDDLSVWQQLLLNYHLNSFEAKFLQDASYRSYVKEELEA